MECRQRAVRHPHVSRPAEGQMGSMRTLSTARRGFSLIELLVVIAIIAILAALIFPTFNRAREQARLTTCMSQMHDISVALKLFREDNNNYPATLLGLAQDANGQFYT